MKQFQPILVRLKNMEKITVYSITGGGDGKGDILKTAVISVKLIVFKFAQMNSGTQCNCLISTP